MTTKIKIAFRAIWVYVLFTCALVGTAPIGAFAQNKPKIHLTLDRDHIVAGEPLLMNYDVTGVSEGTTLVIKNREKGWINIRLVDAEGKEVSSISDDKPLVASVDAKNATPAASFSDDEGLIYSVPKMSSDHRIIIPQTNNVTKAGVYRLLVKVHFLAAMKVKDSSKPEKNGLEKLIELETNPEEKSYKPLKESATFRIVVTSAEPSALSAKATELRDTFLTSRGPKWLAAARELIDWPSDKASEQWQLLAKDARCKPENLATFAGMLSVVGSHDAIQFLGALTWDMNKLNMRGTLTNMYWTRQDLVQKKQISALFAAHGEEVPKNMRLVID